MKVILPISLFYTVFLFGCVTTTDPVSIGEGRYLVSLNAHGGFESDGELLTQTINRANSFCAAQGLQANVLDTKTGGVQLWTPQHNQVVFKCSAPSQ